MVNGVLFRKLRRDLWRQRAQFAAVAAVVSLGVAVFVGASDAYSNLKDSFDRAYTTQRLPDAVLTGPAAEELAADAARLPGDPIVTARIQTDVGARVGAHTLLARVVGVPDGAQPEVARLAVRSGSLPAGSEVVVEQHLADHFGLGPGATIDLYGPTGWQTVTISGSALSTEYFWPARSRQEVMTSPEQFGVVFAPEALVESLAADPDRQLAIFARDRTQATTLVAAATSLAASQGLVIATRTEQPSYVTLDQDVESFGTFASLLPVLFLVAAVLGAFILLSRVVSAQRAVIGTLTANGVAPSRLRRHYLGYGVVVGAVGSVPGLVGGYLLGAWFTTMYTDAVGLPLHVVSLHPLTLAVGLLAGISAAALAAWGPARAAAAVAPGEAMRITPPGGGRRSLLEAVVPAVRRLPARWRMVLRGVTRSRRRAALTVVGVAVSLSLVVVFAGLRDTVTGMLDRQYGDIDRSDGQLYAVDSHALPALLAAARADPAVQLAEPFTRADVSLTSGEHRYDTLLLGLLSTTALHHFVDTTGSDVALPDDGGVVVGEGLRRSLGLHAGDPLAITFAADERRLVEPVVGFVDEPMTAVAYISITYLDTVLGAPTASGALIRLSSGTDRDAAAHRVGSLPGAAAYIDSAGTDATMRDAFAIIDVLVGVMLVFAIIMSGALLFNAMSANVAERSVELGTLAAAGMSRAVVSRLVATENLLLTLIGIPLGIGTGTLIARWFMAQFETEGYRWTLRMQPSTVVVVAVGMLLAALLSQLPVLRTVRRIDLSRIVRERAL